MAATEEKAGATPYPVQSMEDEEEEAQDNSSAVDEPMEAVGNSFSSGMSVTHRIQSRD